MIYIDRSQTFLTQKQFSFKEYLFKEITLVSNATIDEVVNDGKKYFATLDKSKKELSVGKLTQSNSTFLQKSFRDYKSVNKIVWKTGSSDIVVNVQSED